VGKKARERGERERERERERENIFLLKVARYGIK